MKQYRIIIFLAIVLSIAAMSCTTINTTPNECPYEHGECIVPTCSNYAPSTDPREYQIELELDAAYIYDGHRLVGVLPSDTTQAFDKLMIQDNQ